MHTKCSQCGAEASLENVNGELLCKTCAVIKRLHERIKENVPNSHIEMKDNDVVVSVAETKSQLNESNYSCMDYQCPKCKSENIRRYKDLYMEGVTRTTSEHRFMGWTENSAFVGTGTTYDTSITDFAQTLSPPERKPYEIRTLIFILTTIVTTIILTVGVIDSGLNNLENIVSEKLDFFLLPIGMGIFSAFGIVQWIKAYKWNSEEFPSLYRDWCSSYVCLRYGYRFYYKE